MPTLLWRVLAHVGYTEEQRPVYSWVTEEPSDRDHLVAVEVTVPPLHEDSEWEGWRIRAYGVTPGEGASRVAFSVLRIIMERFPLSLAQAMAGVFPRGDPTDTFWEQSPNMARWPGIHEIEDSDNAAMSAMFAMMQTLDATQSCMNKINGWNKTLMERQEKKKKRHSDRVRDLRLQIDLITATRDDAEARERAANKEIATLRARVARYEQYERNADRMMAQLVTERNEARNDAHQLGHWLFDREQYITQLHEDYHVLYNQLHHVPAPGAAEMEPGVINPDGGEEDADLPPAPAPAPDDDVVLAAESDVGSEHE